MTGFNETYPYYPNETFFSLHHQTNEIMHSSAYKKLVNHRSNPENTSPSYNIVNWNKILFVNRASLMFPHYTHYIWTDFGYFRNQAMVPTEVCHITFAIQSNLSIKCIFD